jgi:glycosyltransferase involved in cell wall biosynthesis
VDHSKRKIKVLQIASPSGLYGAERWILALVNNLDIRKFDSYIGSIKDQEDLTVPICKEARNNNICTKVFESYGRLSFKSIFMLRKYIIENKIDVLHTHGYKGDFIGLFAVLGTKCKIITTPHGWTNKPDLKLRLYEILDRVLFMFFNAVVPLSKELFESLNSIPVIKKKLYLIENGVDTKEVDACTAIADELANLKREGLFIIGYIGRLTHGKGLDVLLRSFARHRKSHWRIAIVGEGEQNDDLKALAKILGIDKFVIFFGYRSDRLNLLKGFDVFVLPSRSEGIPRCLMEAMAANVATVASDIAGCKNLISHGDTGLLFEKDSEISLANAIDRIEFDILLKNRLIINANKLIHRKFSAARMAEKYQYLYAIEKKRLFGDPKKDIDQ